MAEEFRRERFEDEKKYSGCLDFYSDVCEDSSDNWSPVVLVQSGRHLGVLESKVKLSK